MSNIYNWLSTYEKRIRSIYEQSARTHRGIEQAFGRWAERMKQVDKMAQRIRGYIQGKSFEKSLEKFFRIIQELPKFSEYLSEMERESIVFLNANNWPPIVDMSIPFATKVVELGKKGENAAIQKLLISYYSNARLKDEILPGWRSSKMLKKRMPILEKAIHAHIRKDYELSVPAILSQLDGFIADSVGFTGFLTKERRNKILKEIHGISVGISRPYLEQLLFDYFSAVFEPFNFGKKPKPILNRPAILHGHNVEYAKRSMSLKAILLVNLYVNILDNFCISAKDGSKYHRPGCHFLSRIQDESKVYYGTPDQAEADGKKPCKVCFRP
jgi:hypothetical protein